MSSVMFRLSIFRHVFLNKAIVTLIRLIRNTITGNTTMTGNLVAATKSFDIPHPTKEGYSLRYGVLEGPEHGVYFRGIVQSEEILLPDYWLDLGH